MIQANSIVINQTQTSFAKETSLKAATTPNLTLLIPLAPSIIVMLLLSISIGVLLNDGNGLPAQQKHNRVKPELDMSINS